MTIKNTKTLAALVFPFASADTSAMGVALVVTTPTLGLAAGNFVSVDALMDFAGEPTLGGGFNIFYDATALAVDSYVSNDIGGCVNRDSDLLDGVLQSWAFSDFSGLSGPHPR